MIHRRYPVKHPFPIQSPPGGNHLVYYIAGSDKTDPASFGQAHPFADLKVAGNLVIDQRFVLFTHADIYWVTPDLTQTGSPPLLQKHLPGKRS